jgi:bacillithiol biosynthesis deacetylase BshB1
MDEGGSAASIETRPWISRKRMTKKSDLALLAFAPHPDDAEIFCGGLLASSAERGYSTGIVDLSRGELSTRGDLGTRAKESAAAGVALKLTVRENLDIPDGAIGIEGPATIHQQTKRVVAAIRRLRPEVILAPYWEERHPDHPGASALVTRAAFLSGLLKFDCGEPELSPFSARQILYYQMRYELAPSMVVDISAVVEQKYNAISCYHSQVGTGEKPAEDKPQTLIGSELNLSSLKARDQYYGAMIGTAAGEAFRMREVVAIADPVAHIRREQKPMVYFFRPE